MKYKHHKYTWANRFSVSHRWEFVGPVGAVSFHVSLIDNYEPSAGLEFHHTEACGFRTDEAPDHINCTMTGGRCWHDGTSLYAIETLWPMIQPKLRNGDHAGIFAMLELEADRHFDELLTAKRLEEAA